MEKTHPAMKLMDAIEALFASGADGFHSEDELLELIKGLRWSSIVHSIVHNSTILYEYATECPLRYRGAKLLCECDRAFRLYQATEPAQVLANIFYQRSLELWVSEEMDLFVTSCFRISTGAAVTEYRAWKGNDWLDTELEIDFSLLARNLTLLSEIAAYGDVPFYELGVYA